MMIRIADWSADKILDSFVQGCTDLLDTLDKLSEQDLKRRKILGVDVPARKSYHVSGQLSSHHFGRSEHSLRNVYAMNWQVVPADAAEDVEALWIHTVSHADDTTSFRLSKAHSHKWLDCLHNPYGPALIRFDHRGNVLSAKYFLDGTEVSPLEWAKQSVGLSDFALKLL